jgi:hypothetical protein
MNLNTSEPTRLKNYPQARKEREFLDFRLLINKCKLFFTKLEPFLLFAMLLKPLFSDIFS